MAPFAGIVRVDRHGLLPYKDAGSEVRNGTPAVTPASPLLTPPTAVLTKLRSFYPGANTTQAGTHPRTGRLFASRSIAGLI